MKKYFGVILCVVCVIFLLNAFFIPVNADWSMYRSGPSRTGVGTGNIETVPTLLWKSNITWEQIQGAIEEIHTFTTPAVVDGVVYICSSSLAQTSNSGSFLWCDAYALNATNGAEIWDYMINSTDLLSAPAVFNGVVYFGSDGAVYALSASNGALLWNSTSPNPIGQSSPAVVDGVVYIGGFAGVVYALNATNGDIIWNVTAGTNVGWSPPTVVDGVVYIGSEDNNIYALNANSGSQLWKSNVDGWVAASPAVANGVVYVSSPDGNIYALNTATGHRLWKFYTLGGRGTSPPAVANGLVYFDSYNGNDYALNAATGKKVWNITIGTGTGTPPIVVGEIVITARPNPSGIYGLNAENGAVIWFYPTNNTGEPVVDNGIMYFGADQVYALASLPSSSPSPSLAPSPSIPEFPAQSLIIMVTAFAAIVLSVVIIAKKRINSKLG